jgi:hypothetical protein
MPTWPPTEVWQLVVRQKLQTGVLEIAKSETVVFQINAAPAHTTLTLLIDMDEAPDIGIPNASFSAGRC